jgi:hypothetical protein
MLYWLGLPVVALYDRLAVGLPVQTEGFAPSVIVGLAISVIVMGISAPIQPVRLFLTESVAL